MVDFGELKKSKARAVQIDPKEIFRRLPKPKGINDLYGSQSDVLEAWFKRRDETDLVLKLHTGGGKTLVGLLIAQSHLNERSTPAVYLCPTNQLVDQTLAKAKEYGIRAVAYQKGEDLPAEFQSGEATLVCTYKALFNGKSKFGLAGKQFQSIGLLIADDAHVASGEVRDSFTLRIEREEQKELYDTLTNAFRNDFKQIDRLGTFDDIVNAFDRGVLEVPYWSFEDRLDQVRQLLRPLSEASIRFEWPLLRDNLKYCHALITSRAFVITPLYPLVDLFPTFSECPRRVFISATIPDDTEMVRTFDADPKSLGAPISSSSLAGVGERMILVPQLMRFNEPDFLAAMKGLAESAAKKKQVSTVVLVPSRAIAKHWEDVCTLVDSTGKITAAIDQLTSGKSKGPFLFANRYDGIDLPHDACRVLIMWGMPQGSSEYDLYRSNSFLKGKAVETRLALRIEQGIGRGSRGGGDYCVVILAAPDLTAWVGKADNLRLLTQSTQAQMKMGTEVSRKVTSAKEFIETVDKCLNRDDSWIEYHAETLAELTQEKAAGEASMRVADVERRAFKLYRDNHHDKAAQLLVKLSDDGAACDPQTSGWLKQFAAKVTYSAGDKDRSQKLQQEAYSKNRYVLKPIAKVQYSPLPRPGRQAVAISKIVAGFLARLACVAEFDQVVSHLVPEASSNQFEQAMEDFGKFLGFSSERPENHYGVGPDVLWLVSDTKGWIIEAKSRKNGDKPLNKGDHGQLMVSSEWFREQYPKLEGVRVAVHPAGTSTPNSVATESFCLTLGKLYELVADARQLLVTLCESNFPEDKLVELSEQQLGKSSLTPDALAEKYLVRFSVTSKSKDAET